MDKHSTTIHQKYGWILGLYLMHVYVLFYGEYRSSGVHEHEAEILFIMDG
jgi:hypothetical protein